MRTIFFQSYWSGIFLISPTVETVGYMMWAHHMARVISAMWNRVKDSTQPYPIYILCAHFQARAIAWSISK